jgi:hypothetical protein
VNIQQDKWGSGVGFSPYQKIIRYSNISVAQQKTNPQYNNSQKSTTSSKRNFSMTTTGSIVKTGGTIAGTAGGGTGSLLRKNAYRELKLFEICHGTYVEGKIVGEVIQPMMGGTTLIQDNDDDVLLVCF